jgi:hypothetical protein
MALNSEDCLYGPQVLAEISRRVESRLLKATTNWGIRGSLGDRPARDGVREITNAFERLLLEAFEKILPGDSTNREKLGALIPRLDNHYAQSREVQPGSKESIERQFYLKTFRSIWYLYTLRNWVSHEARQVTTDDYVECLRAFDAVVSWHRSLFSDGQDTWFIPLEVEGIYLLDAESGRSFQVPRSVYRLKTAFEKAYMRGDYKTLKGLLDERYFSRDIDFFPDRDEFINSIKSFLSDLGGASGVRLELDFNGFDLDRDGSLWWRVQISLHKPGVIEDRGHYNARLSGLQEETAKILELSWTQGG